MKKSRRQFLRTSCAALSAAAVSAGFDRFGLMSALASPLQSQAVTDYKALVCVYLTGGNDGNNTVVPNYGSGYTAYSAARGGLALPQSSLLEITPSSLGLKFGLHPQLTRLQSLFAQQKMALVCNVGPLVQPITRAQFLAGAPRPFQLFSHSDQTQCWQTSRADVRSQIGWGGLIADRSLALNSGVNFPAATSVAGTVMFGQGMLTHPLGIAPAPTPLTEVLVLSGFDATPESAALRSSFNHLRTIDREPHLVAASQDAMSQAIVVSEALTGNPALTTAFPDTALGRQLLQVARMIKLNQTEPRMGLKRQIFFCQYGDFDTHGVQLDPQATLLAELDAAMKAFYDATVELGLSSDITTFTLTDFGRTLQPSGGGSDHGWGNHLMVMGDSVRGGDFYGVPGANGSVFPTLQLGGVDDTDHRGRWIPTTAVEQFGATLAKWFGLGTTDIATVFPLLGRFTTPDLGFMNS